MPDKNKTLFEWLCLIANFLRSRRVYVFFTCLAFLVLLFLPVILCPLFKMIYEIENVGSVQVQSEILRNSALVIAAIFGVPFIIWRSFVAQKQVDVAEQGQITDRINKAVEGLGAEKTVKKIFEKPLYKKTLDKELECDDDGNPIPAKGPDGTEIIERESYEHSSPNLEVRIGAIYALERVAQDSIRDHIPIMKTLCAYIRENAPKRALGPTIGKFNHSIPRVDIQAAITVIGSRSEERIKLERKEKFHLDLRETDLSGANLMNGNFSAALFDECRLEAAFFQNCILEGTRFNGALLNQAKFGGAKLRGTIFDHAIISSVGGRFGGDSDSINSANIYGISIAAADVSGIHSFGKYNSGNFIFGDGDTILNGKLDFVRNKFEDRLEKIASLRDKGDSAQAYQLEVELYESNNHVDWFPYEYDDEFRVGAHQAFLNRLNLKEWPYQ